MKLNSIIMRPLAPAAAYAPVSHVPARPYPAAALLDVVGDRSVMWGPVTADTPRLSQLHQPQAQAELALIAVRPSKSNGTNGSTVEGIETGATKRFVDVARGVPPRGRPV